MLKDFHVPNAVNRQVAPNHLRQQFQQHARQCGTKVDGSLYMRKRRS
jgi:hypothetical protein